MVNRFSGSLHASLHKTTRQVGLALDFVRIELVNGWAGKRTFSLGRLFGLVWFGLVIAAHVLLTVEFIVCPSVPRGPSPAC